MQQPSATEDLPRFLLIRSGRDEIELDRQTQTVKKNGESSGLIAKHVQVLHLLLLTALDGPQDLRDREVVTYEQFRAQIWSEHKDQVPKNYLHTAINKLGLVCDRKWFENIRDTGYRYLGPRPVVVERRGGAVVVGVAAGGMFGGLFALLLFRLFLPLLGQAGIELGGAKHPEAPWNTAIFASLLGGLAGAMLMLLMSEGLHNATITARRWGIAGLMFSVGGALLLLVHVLSSKYAVSSFEWVGFFVHGGTASTVAIIVVRFGNVLGPGRRWLAALIPSGCGLLAYTAVSAPSMAGLIDLKIPVDRGFMLFLCTITYLLTIHNAVPLAVWWSRRKPV